MRRSTRAWIAGCGLLLASACDDSADSTQPRDVEAEVNESISTVVNVRWQTDEPSIGYIEYGPTQELEWKTPLEDEAQDEHALSLLGLRPDTLYYYRVVTWDGAAAGAS